MMEFNKAINTYLLCKYPDQRFGRHIEFDKMTLNVTDETRVLISAKGKVVIIGYCVDAHGEWENHKVADCVEGLSLSMVMEVMSRLAGEFVVFIQTATGETVVFNDPISIIPVVYDEDMVASNERFIAKAKGYAPAEYLKDLIAGGYANGHAKPGELTGYKEIKYLLPNHYLDMSIRKPIRYFPCKQLSICHGEEDFDHLIDKFIFLESNILKRLSEIASLRAGLTSGTDSRLLLAMMRHSIPDKLNEVTFFTIDYGDENDNFVSKALAEKYHLKHMCITPKRAPEDVRDALRELLPLDEDVEADKLWTLYTTLGSGELCLGGAIVDQIAKSGKFEDFPEWMVSPTFCTAIFGHSSRTAREAMREWYDQAKSSLKGYSIADLDAWEFRCGRWIGVNAHPYAFFNMAMFNSWNCRELISLLCSVPRSRRYHLAVHIGVIKRIAPEMLEMPFNGGAKPISRIRHIFTYLAKYYLARVGMLRLFKEY